MQTLQILDGAETFLRPLDGNALVLGSASDADIVLRADGVAPRHARIDFEGADATLARLDGDVVVGGRKVDRVRLDLGMRLELGRAVVVVGQSVARSAGPDDVLTEGPRSSTRVRRSTASKSSKLPIVVGLLLAVVAGAALVLGGGADPNAVPQAFHDVERMRRAGSFELAETQIESLRRDWATDATRQQRLQELIDRVERTKRLVDERRHAIVVAASTRTYASFSDELRADEARHRDEDVGIAARIVRAGLSDLLRDLPSALPPAVPSESSAPKPSMPVAQSQPTSQPKPQPISQPTSQPKSTPPAASAPMPAVTPPTAPVAQAPMPSVDAANAAAPAANVSRDDVAAVVDEATRLVAMGQFRAALDQLQFAAAGAVGDDGVRLTQAAQELRRAAKVAVDRLIERAQQQQQAGQSEAMLAEIEDAILRFPHGGEFTALDVMRDELRRATASALASAPVRSGRADEAVRRATLVEVAPVLDHVQQAEALGNYAAAVVELRPLIERVRTRDPDYAVRLQQRCEELAGIAEFQAAVGQALGHGRKFTVALRSGSNGELHGTAGAHLQATTSDGEVEIGLDELAPAGVARLCADAQVGTEAAFGAAALLYRAEAQKDAEQVLQKLLAADAGLKERVDRAIARGRGEPLDPRGYQKTRDGFVAVAVIEAEKTAGKMLARVDAAVRSKDATVRQSFVTDTLALGPTGMRPVVVALQRVLEKEAERLERSGLKKQLDKVAQQRQELDAARAFAKELIFDEVKYFYPYSPPQVSSDRYAEYVRVQAEVDRRVAAVRTLWNEDRLHAKAQPAVTEALARIDWVASVLRDFGELDALALVGLEWARVLRPGEPVTVKSYCATARERADFDEWELIEAYNQRIFEKLDSGEREQVTITNEYRRMFGHRPLVVDIRLRDSARGHAEEMSKLGYFSHFSPTPGRRTPGERMRLAGYTKGGSENIALHDSAASAHYGWCHSSGHHRNLLNPAHTEFGVSGVGRYWVQNFGQGSDYRNAITPAAGR